MMKQATWKCRMSEAAEALTVMLGVVLVGVVAIAVLTGWL